MAAACRPGPIRVLAPRRPPRRRQRTAARAATPVDPRPCPSRDVSRPGGAGGARLLDLDGGPVVLEDLADLLRLVLAHPLLDRLRGALHQVLGLLEAEARDCPDLLDHVDLLVAGLGQDDGELRLLLGGRGPGRAAG